MVDPDPFVTLPAPSHGPTEPSDFLARLADSMAASARSIAWFSRFTSEESSTPSA